MGWQPIETAPWDGTTVDLWSELSGTRETDARWTGSRWVRLGWNEMNDGPGVEEVYHPTHWMPLPDPPKA